MDKDRRPTKKSFNAFHCPQHECHDCGKKTTDAGGLIYRCRFCPMAFCEDCLDWDTIKLVGETLPEYEMLGFPAVTQAFFIVCASCNEDPFSKYQGDFMQANYDSLKLAQEQQEEAASKAEEAAEVNGEEKVKLTFEMSPPEEMSVKRSTSPLPKSSVIDLTVDDESSAGSMTEGDSVTNGSGIATPKVPYDDCSIATHGGRKRKSEAFLEVGRRALKARFSY